jgi:hypothetical protein
MNNKLEHKKNDSEKNTNGKRFPHFRYWAGVGVVAASAAALLLFRGCGPKHDSIILAPAVKTPCGCLKADTTRVPGAKGAPDTVYVGIAKMQGCNPDSANYDTACGCAEKKPAPVKRKKVTIRKEAPKQVVAAAECDATILGSPGGQGIKKTVNGDIGAHASDLLGKLTKSDGRKAYIRTSLDVSAEGIITNASFTPICDGGCAGDGATVAATIGTNLKGRQTAAPGTPCTATFTSEVK